MERILSLNINDVRDPSTAYDFERQMQQANSYHPGHHGEPIIYQGEEITVTISLGVSLCPDDARSTGDLILFADKAMYQAKRKGGNGFFFYTSTSP